MSEELKPCPFCGSNARLEEKTDCEYRSLYRIACVYIGCGVATQWHYDYNSNDSVRKVIAIWNTRERQR